MKRSEFIKGVFSTGALYATGLSLVKGAEADRVKSLRLLEIGTGQLNPIPCPTNLSAVLAYFVKALLDTSYNPAYNFNPEQWPQGIHIFRPPFPLPPEITLYPFIDQRSWLEGPLVLPVTRGEFYGYIDSYTTQDIELITYWNWFSTINGNALYTYPEPQTGWPIKAVNDWGKIKSLELILFGSVGNGASLTTSSSIGTGNLRSRLEALTNGRADLTYLRYALIEFDTYGECHQETAQTPAPTNPVVNTSARTFNWTNAPGFTSPSNYEYKLNNGEWLTVTSKPISISPNIHVPVGGLLVRTKGGGYTEPSDTIQNDADYTSPIDLYIWVTINNSTSYTVYAAVIEPLQAPLNIMGAVNIVLTPNTPQLYPFSVFLQSGQNYATDNGFASSINTGSLANQVSSLGLVISPTTVDSRPININLNEQAPI